ncbi:MAG TPA: YbfB/YjiJ family MFS transporter [Abditibacteriaceae bacterium]|jgi:predicted MFS family arabinose efflux permease
MNFSSPRAQTTLAALWLALGPAVALGFGRFGYALVLPAMRADLGWTYSQAGMLNTANAMGYLLGALMAAPLLRRIPARRALLGGLAAAIAALFLAGFVREFSLLLAARALVGVAGAWTFISATGLAARLGSSEADGALALGISISGPGFGTVATGILVPFVLNGDAAHWPRAWMVMGALGALLWPLIAWGTRSAPTNAQPKNTMPVASEVSNTSLVPMALIVSAYFLFGLGYIAYMTFLVAYVRALQASAATVAWVWATLGVSMIVSTFVWKGPLAKNRGGQTLALMGLGGAASALFPLVSDALPALVLSAIGFGLSTMPVFTAVTMLIRRHLAPSAWSSAIAWATVIFAAGQSLGPLGSGALSDRFGLVASLLWTASILTIAALVAWQHKPIASAS